MIAKAQGGRLLASCQVSTELHLAAQRDACADPFGLAPLRIADRFGQREDLLSLGTGHEEHAIIVAKDHILAAHCPRPDTLGLHPLTRAPVTPQLAPRIPPHP